MRASRREVCLRDFIYRAILLGCIQRHAPQRIPMLPYAMLPEGHHRTEERSRHQTSTHAHTRQVSLMLPVSPAYRPYDAIPPDVIFAMERGRENPAL